MESRKTNEVHAAIMDIPQEVLADTLALLFTESKMPETKVAGRDKPELANFAQALLYLKKYYDFPELGFFATEADLVYINTGDRKILLSEKMPAAVPARAITMPEGSEEEPPQSAGMGGGRFSNLEI